MARVYTSWLKAYMQYTAASEAPDAFHFWTGVSTIAGALRRNVWIDQVGFQWTPNFYIFLVGPAGVVTKSTSLSYGMGLLEELPDVFFGPPSASWQGMMPAFQDAMTTVKWTDDDGNEQKTPVSALTVPISELGTFLKARDDDFMSFLIHLWDGQLAKRDFSHRTQTRGNITIQNPWVNIISCTTPTWLQTNVPEALVGGGFFSRVIFVYGNKKRRLVAYPSRQWRPGDLAQVRQGLVSDLKEMAQIRGAYKLTTDAYEWGEKWYENHWATVAPHMASVRYEPYKARKQTHLHKLAMVLAASYGDTKTITVDHLQEAETILRTAEASMIVVFDSIGGSDEARYIREITGIVKGLMPMHNNLVPLPEVWAHLVNIMNFDDFKAGIRSGAEAGLFRTKYTGKNDDQGKSILGIVYIEPKSV